MIIWFSRYPFFFMSYRMLILLRMGSGQGQVKAKQLSDDIDRLVLTNQMGRHTEELLPTLLRALQQLNEKQHHQQQLQQQPEKQQQALQQAQQQVQDINSFQTFQDRLPNEENKQWELPGASTKRSSELKDPRWAPAHEQSCRRVCDHCRRVAPLRVAALCQRDCDWSGRMYRICFTLWTMEVSTS